MRKYLAFAMLLVLFFGCIDQPPPNPPPEDKPDVVEYGDEVDVYYAVWINETSEQEINGTINKTSKLVLVDTNMESVAIDEGIYSSGSPKYKPLKFRVLLGDGMIDGFVNAVVGMQANQTKEFIVTPEEGYGNHNPLLVFNIPRYYERPISESVPLDFFASKGILIEKGMPFETDVGTSFISEVDEEAGMAEITYLFEIGDVFYFNGIPQAVIGSSGENYTIMVDVTEDGRYHTISPLTNTEVYVTATNITNETITFDENHPLAGKDLYYLIELSDIWKSEDLHD